MGRVIKADDVLEKPNKISLQWNCKLKQIIKQGPIANQFIEQSKDKIIELSLAMTERIVQETIVQDTSILEKIYEQTLLEVGKLEPISIRVHPTDLKKTNLSQKRQTQGFTVIEDNKVGLGGCIVEACGVKVDRSIETVLETLKKAMEQTVCD